MFFLLFNYFSSHFARFMCICVLFSRLSLMRSFKSFDFSIVWNTKFKRILSLNRWHSIQSTFTTRRRSKKKTTAINDAEMQQNINQIGIRHLKESKCSHGSHTAKWLKCCREKKRHQTNRRKLRHMENMWTHRFECACV